MALIPRLFGNRAIFDPTTFDIWDPFTSLDTSLFQAQFDWKETPEAHIIKADLPGLKKEDIKVELEEGNILRISGERVKEVEEKTNKWHRVERSFGKFVRRFRLPENAKTDEVKAKIEDGVLTVTIPKKEVKQQEAKPIEICAGQGGAEQAGSKAT